jgi:hypothetical protein
MEAVKGAKTLCNHNKHLQLTLLGIQDYIHSPISSE